MVVVRWVRQNEKVLGSTMPSLVNASSSLMDLVAEIWTTSLTEAIANKLASVQESHRLSHRDVSWRNTLETARAITSNGTSTWRICVASSSCMRDRAETTIDSRDWPIARQFAQVIKCRIESAIFKNNFQHPRLVSSSRQLLLSPLPRSPRLQLRSGPSPTQNMKRRRPATMPIWLSSFLAL